MAKTKDESPPFKKAVPVDLAEADIKKKEKRIVHALTERKKIKAAAKLATAEHRKGINDLDKEIDALREQIEDGTETKEVLCVAIKDFRNNVVKTVRKDTRAVVETREMTAEERQETFPEVPARGARAKRGAKPLPPGKAIAAARNAEGGGDEPDPDDEGEGAED